MSDLELTGDQLAELERRWLAAISDPHQARKARRLNLRRNLSRRVRVRLAVQGVITSAGIWLADHGHPGAARRLWRI